MFKNYLLPPKYFLSFDFYHPQNIVIVIFIYSLQIHFFISFSLSVNLFFHFLKTSWLMS